ncbi:DUF2892 domain-containing protein [Pseudohalocynthiibacter aestuariivivens]|jgi:Inner membrane protein YgaP-like, transmembrane domain|uniref:DUF2892 domain-containing protein n=1 Tax=Pseudohalocynthiibacter aestuariivivens TaxID=1591409 RepID=A0ABV5JGK4_9RHOB|nr:MULTISPECIES: DUF2892 domain-containing protein [Pseudohalocynthiibacter]MBS9718959.1 DUF2892 domain-containing protein [Pseudohalocynthiibacter aestuariivivens]MCK0103557.1 DUF2892 domain-containing protein [Pseudohalocynthiibacter sp. F2068]
MSKNVGGLDRGLRALIGVVLLGLALFSNITLFESGLMKWGAIIVGLVMLATSAMRVCPLYLIFGIKTCRSSK